MKADFKKYPLKVSAENLKMFGTEREYSTGFITPENRLEQLAIGLNWYNYVSDMKDQRKFIEDWIKFTRPTTVKQDLAMWHKTSDRYIRATYCNLARLSMQGFELTEQEKLNIWESITNSHQLTKAANLPEDDEPVEPRIGIQERMDNQALVVVDEVEANVSKLLRGTIKPDEINSPLGNSKLSAIHYKKVAKFLEPVLKEYAEIKDARATKKSKDPQHDQFIEGWDWVTNKRLKAVQEYLDVCMGTANRLALEKKVARARKKKPTDKAKLVRHFKFLPKLDELKLASLQPVGTLNSSEVWVYNSKTKKLGVYRGEFNGSIMIKGSSFIGFAVNSSVQKKLRKPEKQIAEFQALNKNQLRKYFEGIKGVEHRLNGRSNLFTLLLRTN